MAPIDQKDKLNNISRLLSRQRLEKMRPEQSSDRTVGKDKSSAVIDDGYVQSSRGIEINAIKERVNQLPEVDMQKVERLRQQIAGGVYQVSSEILAENILAASVDGNQDG
jgi:flagellar biosynthesis anti-sigma factor FlgM